MQDKLARMLQLVETCFDMEHDKEQLFVDDSVVQQLLQLHPATLQEINEGDGPIMWLIVFPTTEHDMQLFISGELNEKQLYERSIAANNFNCIYLCSVLVLEEYRAKGLAYSSTCNAIRLIAETFEIQHLFVWPFGDAGLQLAKKIAEHCNLMLHVKKR